MTKTETVQDIVVERMNALGLTQDDVSKRWGGGQTTVGQIVAGNTKSPRRWRQLAEALGVEPDRMRAAIKSSTRKEDGRTRIPRLKDMPDSARRLSAQRANDRSLPVLGKAIGGGDGEYIFNGLVIDQAPCPPQLADIDGAYSVYSAGSSMEPRFFPRELLYVHPGIPPRVGDDVIVQVHPEGAKEGDVPHGYLKRFKGYRGDDLVLEQYNPAMEIAFPADRVESVHVVTGRYS